MGRTPKDFDPRTPPGPAPKRGPGRPSKLNADKAEQIFQLVKSGNFIETAADFVGIDRTTIFNWIRRGKNAAAGPYREFFIAFRHAEATWTASLVAAATIEAQKDGRFALQMLGRRNRLWSEKVSVQHKGAIGGYDAQPKMAELVDADPVANAQFHDFLARLAALGTFESASPDGSAADASRSAESCAHSGTEFERRESLSVCHRSDLRKRLSSTALTYRTSNVGFVISDFSIFIKSPPP